MEKSNRTKEREFRTVNWEKWAESVHLDFLHLWRWGRSFLPGTGRRPLTSGSYTLLQGRRGGVRELSLHLLLSNSFSWKYPICQGTIFESSMFWTPSTSFSSSRKKRKITFFERQIGQVSCTVPPSVFFRVTTLPHHLLGSRIQGWSYAFLSTPSSHFWAFSNPAI